MYIKQPILPTGMHKWYNRQSDVSQSDMSKKLFKSDTVVTTTANFTQPQNLYNAFFLQL